MTRIHSCDTRDALPTLDGERVRLRWLIHADAADLLCIFGDPEVTRYMGIATQENEDGARAFIDDIQGLARRDELYQWGIALADSDRVIGTVTFASIQRKHRRLELGFALGREHWGRGYATEAVRVAIAHAFDAMGMHRIEADVDPRNESSLALLTRLGFTREGYMPERWLADGEWQDTVFFGLLASSFTG